MRRLSSGAIRDMLKAQGVSPERQRFRGAYHVLITTSGVADPIPAAPAAPLAAAAAPRGSQPTTAFRVRRAPTRDRWTASRARRPLVNSRAVEAAVAERLQAILDQATERDPAGERMLVRRVTVSATTARTLGVYDPSEYGVRFIGGGDPRPGENPALVWPLDRGEDDAMHVAAELVVQPMRVVATRPTPRGALIVRSAVRLEPAPLEEIDRPSAVGYASLDEAIGTEASRSIRPGDVLSALNTAPPVIVRKGEEVEVFAGGGGVSVRLIAVAQRDGRMGEMVEVEAYDGEETFSARVVGDRRLAVLGAGATAGGLIRSGGIQ